MADVNDKNKAVELSTSKVGSKVRVFKNGIHFNFQKGQQGESP